ncbi:MAG: bifunctional DNA primase/polymerase [Ignavibacteriaceae bacterium]|nr:bifunctional DNA primase/polymerase [Ignavibacteriaceae bacterium]
MNWLESCAMRYFEVFGFNVLPLKWKKPMIPWERWQNEMQTKELLNTFNWSDATGFGAVMGIGLLRCIDIDGADKYEVVKLILEKLGLPEKYCWVVQSGSGVGFHIYFICPLPNGGGVFDRIGGEKGVYKFVLKEKGLCHHIELRLRNCQTTLPPSKHESGGVYSFYYNEPIEKPAMLEIEKIVDMIVELCEIENNKNEKKRDTTHQFEKKSYYDMEQITEALEVLAEKLPPDCYDEWYRIGFALSTLGEEGEELFVKMSLGSPHYNDSEKVIRKKYNELAKESDGRISAGTIFHLAEQYGWEKPIIRIWYFDKEKIKLSRPRFKRLLEQEGCCKIRIDKKFVFVRVIDNRVREITSADGKELAMEYLQKIPASEFETATRDEVMDLLIRNSTQIFSDNFFEFLITKQLEFCTDTEESSFFFFENGIVEVTKDALYLSPYENMKGCIWEDEIIKREFNDTKIRSDFEDFLYKAIGREPARMEALKSAIGFMLHRLKRPGEEKAVMLIDEIISDGAKGRAGKGLTIKAIGKLRKTVTVDGRNFSPSKNFAFQRVGVDCNVIALEDLDKNFTFEKLFSVISDGITIERKNKDEIYLPYEKSPKLICSTNYVMKGSNDSAMDRQCIIEYTAYYNKNHKPEHEYGKRFFSGWNEDEWNSFFKFMLECVQFYLMKGIVAYPMKNIELKMMIADTSEDFVEFAEDLKPGEKYTKKDLLEKFQIEFPEWIKLHQRKFTTWLKNAAKYKGWKVEESKSGSERFIVFLNDESEDKAA